MTDHISNSKRIAKNTLLLYVRMFLMMGITLYTSRVILETLGVEDYGIYNVIGSLVSMFGILNASMTAASQRYITISLGKNNSLELQKIFSISLIIHIVIGIVSVALVETVGIWFLYNRMTIPIERIDAVFWVLQCSAFSLFVSIISVPYNALIIAHEKMSAFAYISILEAVLKLCVIYILLIIPYDKLIVYSFLLLLVQISIRSCYSLYCSRHFAESKYKLSRDFVLMREMLHFAGWNMFGGLSGIAFGQGLSMLLNVFFGPVVNAARGIAQQVQSAIQVFITNFQTAINPQIIKCYANNDNSQMHLLMERSSRFSFYLMWLLSLPIILETPFVLNIWLTVVPNDTSVFIRIALATTLIYTIINPILTANNATGKVRSYYLICGFLMISILPISYIVLSFGAPAYSVFIVHFCVEAFTQIVRLLMVRKRLHLSIKRYFKNVYLPIFLVATLSFIIPYLTSVNMSESISRFFIVCTTSVISVCVVSFVFGFSSQERDYIILMVRKQINRFQK